MSNKNGIEQAQPDRADRHERRGGDVARGSRPAAGAPLPMRRRNHNARPDEIEAGTGPDAGGSRRRSTDLGRSSRLATFMAFLRKLPARTRRGPARSILSSVLLPLAIVTCGTAFAAFGTQSPLSAALVTFLTSTLAGLSLMAVQAGQMDIAKRVAGMRERFETLEDRAWELRESEERYRTLAEAFGDLLVLHDGDGRIIYGNETYASSLGMPAGSIEGRQFERGSAEAGTRASAPAPRSRLGGSVTETSIETPSGRRWFAWLDLPVRDERHGPLILSVARDITPFRQAEAVLEEARGKAEQASIAKTRFLAMASHEMRTPLNGILGISRLLRGTGLNGEQENYNNAVIASGEALLGLIGDMLDLTMIEAGRFSLREEPFELRETLDAVSELLAPRAHEKDIGLGLFVDPSLPESLTGDAGRLRQILINLAGNAIKYTDKGGVAIRVVPAGTQAPGATCLRFEVCDTGPGLCDADRERVFAEFERSDDAATRRTDGAGLGLAISRAIAGQMGGTIELLETGPRGSVFRLEVSFTTNARRESSREVGALPVFPGRVVLAFSRPMEADCLAEQLGASSGEFRKLASAGSARRWLAKPPRQPFHPAKAGKGGLVIADAAHLMALEERGIDPMAALRGAGWQVAVLLKPDERHRLEAWRSAGASGWLMRPVREESLNEVLRAAAAEPVRPAPDVPAPPLLPVVARHGEHAPGISPQIRPNHLAMNASEALTVLLAEDNDINALLVTAALKRGGIAVERAANGATAVELYREAAARGMPHRVILMDMHMPVMDGDSATRAIRAFEREETLANSAIIALTADEQGAARERAIAAGVNAFQVKPVDPESLLRTVLEHAAALDGHRASGTAG